MTTVNGASEVASDAIAGLEFDLSRMSGQDYHDYAAAGRKDDLVTVANVLARVVRRCPPEWGKPDDPKTYLKLPMFGALKQVMRALSAEVRAEAGK
jgi:hypothetical protein